MITPPPECGALDTGSTMLIVTGRLGQGIRVGDGVRVVFM